MSDPFAFEEPTAELDTYPLLEENLAAEEPVPSAEYEAASGSFENPAASLGEPPSVSDEPYDSYESAYPEDSSSPFAVEESAMEHQYEEMIYEEEVAAVSDRTGATTGRGDARDEAAMGRDYEKAAESEMTTESRAEEEAASALSSSAEASEASSLQEADSFDENILNS